VDAAKHRWKSIVTAPIRDKLGMPIAVTLLQLVDQLLPTN
jgi:hypothetical protein